MIVKGLCPRCRRWYPVTEKWQMRMHHVSGSRRVTCSGSGMGASDVAVRR